MNAKNPLLSLPRPLWALGLACALSGTALAQAATPQPAHPRDPLEPVNRVIFEFNDAVDRAVFKPLASGYQQALPSMVRTGVGNAFSNLGDAWSFVNNGLQLKLAPAGESLIRFGVNTLFGLGGLIDIASDLGIPRHKQDFGLTLAHYGVPSGPYLVLPFLGSSTLRDTLVRPVDTQGDLLLHLNDVPARNSLYVLRVVDLRAQLLRASEVVEGAALDKYSFTRDAYLQRRDSLAGAGAAQGARSDGDIDNPDEPETPDAGRAGKD